MTEQVKLIAITKPLNLNMTAEDLVSYCARVSNPANQENFETSGKLLKYCMENAHWSIFEMVNIVFEINTPRDIARQILRHDNHPQEFSARYANPVEELGFCVREARMQDPKNRQNSIKCADKQLQLEWEHRQKKLFLLIKENYNWALGQGIAKECARVILPEGNTMSRMYVNNTLRNWYHYCEVRKSNGTQLEHIEIAGKVWGLLKGEFEFLKDFDE